jgi:hypothetical protein
MRTLACLVVVVLAGGPAAARPILIEDHATSHLLPAEQLMPLGALAADPDSEASESAFTVPLAMLVPALPDMPIGVLDPALIETMGIDEVVAYRSNVTSEMLEPGDDGFAVSHYALELEDGARSDLAEGLDAPLPAFESATAGDVTSGVAAVPDQAVSQLATGQRDFVRAAVSHVEPAALTLLGVCLFLVAAGTREWRRRNWHRRPLNRHR